MKALIALIACGLLTPATATAQVAGRQILREQAAAYDASREMMGLELRSRAMDEQAEQYRESLNPRRVHRAQEAAALINKGDCAGALALADRANDTRLAGRIEQVCAALAAPATTSAPASR